VASGAATPAVATAGGGADSGAGIDIARGCDVGLGLVVGLRVAVAVGVGVPLADARGMPGPAGVVWTGTTSAVTGTTGRSDPGIVDWSQPAPAPTTTSATSGPTRGSPDGTRRPVEGARTDRRRLTRTLRSVIDAGR
jgi:hypothetical protein